MRWTRRRKTTSESCPRLIEVALPTREISAESARDKSLRNGHISTLHLWWARRPLAASRAVVAEAKDAYRTALAPYREACRKGGVACEYEGGRSANVSEKVSFLVEKTDKGVRVSVKGRPQTEEIIPLADLEASINKAAYVYTDKHLGPTEEIGNKGGSLSNRLQAAMA